MRRFKIGELVYIDWSTTCWLKCIVASDSNDDYNVCAIGIYRFYQSVCVGTNDKIENIPVIIIDDKYMYDSKGKTYIYVLTPRFGKVYVRANSIIGYS